VAVCLLCVLFLLYARHEASLAPPGEPAIEFDTELLDLGTVFQMSEHAGVFKVRNTGTAKLVITNVSAQCGCTATLLSDEEIEPGGETELKVTFKSTMSRRAVKKRITVSSNDPDESPTRLQIKATVVPRLVVEPRLLNFKDVHKKQGAIKWLTIKPSEHEKNVRTLRARSNSKQFRTKIEPNTPTENEYRAKISIQEGVPIGRVSGWLYFYINREPQPCARVHLSARIVGDIDVSPARLIFRQKPGTDANIKTITLESRTAEAFEILSAKSDLPALKVEVSPIEGGKSYSVIPRLTSDAKKGRLKGKITILTNRADEREIVVPVLGTVQ
jgi:hypothetical protein